MERKKYNLFYSISIFVLILIHFILFVFQKDNIFSYIDIIQGNIFMLIFVLVFTIFFVAVIARAVYLYLIYKRLYNKENKLSFIISCILFGLLFIYLIVPISMFIFAALLKPADYTPSFN
ncbi:MAG: hypothetical protein RR543_02800 [Erysipelotrichales bacterium]